MNVRELNNAVVPLVEKGWKVELDSNEAYLQSPEGNFPDELKKAISAAGGDYSNDLHAARLNLTKLIELDAETEHALYTALKSASQGSAHSYPEPESEKPTTKRKEKKVVIAITAIIAAIIAIGSLVAFTKTPKWSAINSRDMRPYLFMR